MAIPVLILEISIGQAYRAGCVLAWHHAHKRAKGVGFGVVYIGYAIVIYYVPLIAWIMTYFRYSFQSPIPWTGDSDTFFQERVHMSPDRVEAEFEDPDTARGLISGVEYPYTSVLMETTLWSFFTWFVVWLCMYVCPRPVATATDPRAGFAASASWAA